MDKPSIARSTSPHQSAAVPDPNSCDFLLQDEGSIVLLVPLTLSARLWAADHIGRDNGYQPYWPTVVIEHRYVADIIAGITDDGLAVLS